jgi:hypothetical protein
MYYQRTGDGVGNPRSQAREPRRVFTAGTAVVARSMRRLDNVFLARSSS